MAKGKKTGVGQGMIGGASTGALVGGPTGAAIGAAVGGIAGYMSAAAKERQRQAAIKAEGLRQAIKIQQQEQKERSEAFKGLQLAFQKALTNG